MAAPPQMAISRNSSFGDLEIVTPPSTRASSPLLWKQPSFIDLLAEDAGPSSVLEGWAAPLDTPKPSSVPFPSASASWPWVAPQPASQPPAISGDPSLALSSTSPEAPGADTLSPTPEPPTPELSHVPAGEPADEPSAAPHPPAAVSPKSRPQRMPPARPNRNLLLPSATNLLRRELEEARGRQTVGHAPLRRAPACSLPSPPMTPPTSARYVFTLPGVLSSDVWRLFEREVAACMAQAGGVSPPSPASPASSVSAAFSTASAPSATRAQNVRHVLGRVTTWTDIYVRADSRVPRTSVCNCVRDVLAACGFTVLFMGVDAE